MTIKVEGATGTIQVGDGSSYDGEQGLRNFSKVQITVNGVAGNYTFTGRTPCSTGFKTITNGTIDGVTGQTVVLNGRIEEFNIVPPDGSAYSVFFDEIKV